MLEAELIFIVGVPRSGSTLLEQILSVKENVLGLGETTYFPASLNENFILIKNNSAPRSRLKWQNCC